jgi:hypothetical protein
VTALRDARQAVFGIVLNDERPGVLGRLNHSDYYHLGYTARAGANGFARPTSAADDAAVR